MTAKRTYTAPPHHIAPLEFTRSYGTHVVLAKPFNCIAIFGWGADNGKGRSWEDGGSDGATQHDVPLLPAQGREVYINHQHATPIFADESPLWPGPGLSRVSSPHSVHELLDVVNERVKRSTCVPPLTPESVSLSCCCSSVVLHRTVIAPRSFIRTA